MSMLLLRATAADATSRRWVGAIISACGVDGADRARRSVRTHAHRWCASQPPRRQAEGSDRVHRPGSGSRGRSGGAARRSPPRRSGNPAASIRISGCTKPPGFGSSTDARSAFAVVGSAAANLCSARSSPRVRFEGKRSDCARRSGVTSSSRTSGVAPRRRPAAPSAERSDTAVPRVRPVPPLAPTDAADPVGVPGRGARAWQRQPAALLRVARPAPDPGRARTTLPPVVAAMFE